jgi:hypothetical protein
MKTGVAAVVAFFGFSSTDDIEQRYINSKKGHEERKKKGENIISLWTDILDSRYHFVRRGSSSSESDSGKDCNRDLLSLFGFETRLGRF